MAEFQHPGMPAPDSMPGRLRKLAGGARGAPAILSALPLQARDFLRTRREDQCGRARFVQALDAELDHFVSAQVRQILAGAHAVGCQREGSLLVHAFQRQQRSEEHTSELQSLMRISYAVFCLKKKKNHQFREYKTAQIT